MDKHESAANERVPSERSSAPSIDKELEEPRATTPAQHGNGVVDATPETVDEAAAQDSGAIEGDEEVEYPKAWKLVLITIALCLAVFCMALDNTIIAVAIPKITDQFHALSDVGWYGSSYLLTTCAFQLMFGKLYTFYSIKWVFLTALFIFEIGSLICGVAPSSTALIVGRAVAGVGSAGIFSGAILIVAHTVPLRQRPVYTGLIGAMYGIASVAGPLMGGAFTDNLTWRWCFYINLPFGAVTAIFIFFFFTSPKRKKAVQHGWMAKLNVMDPIGTILFMPGVICLLLALQWGGTEYNWANARIIVLFILFGLLMLAFIGVQIWKQENATVPPRVFKNRSMWSCAMFGACLGSSFFILVYYLPIWFQAIKGVSAVKSGIMSLPMLLGLVVVSIVAGISVSIIGYYSPFMILSSVLMAVGAGLLTTWEPDTGHPKWIGYQFVFGAGVGFGMQQTLIAIQTALPLVDVPIGTAIIMFSQTLGGALFISVGQTVFQNGLIKHLARELPELPQITGVVLSAGATSIKQIITDDFPSALDGVLQAYNDAINETCYVSLAMGALSIVGAVFVEWKSVKHNKDKVAAAQIVTDPSDGAVAEKGEAGADARTASKSS